MTESELRDRLCKMEAALRAWLHLHGFEAHAGPPSGWGEATTRAYSDLYDRALDASAEALETDGKSGDTEVAAYFPPIGWTRRQMDEAHKARMEAT